MRIYIVCCFHAQVLYLGTFLFLRYGPKCSQPIRLQDDTNSHKLKVDQKNVWLGMVKNGCGQSGHGTLKLTVPQE